jgi:glycerol-3-phosphate dehydrogenase
MVNLAPHLVHPLPLLVPGFDGKRPDRLTGVGLNMYDVMARDRLRRGRRPDEEWSPDRHRVISAEETLELIPALESRSPTSAYLFYDCQTDDVRLVLNVLGEAERFGAVFANGAEVTELILDDGRAAGVACTEAESGERFEVRAANVVNATGVWADRIRPEEILAEEEVPQISPSRGTHVTVSQEKLPVTDAACIVPAGEDRTIFVLPWYGRALIGTTDRDYDGDIARVEPSGEDIDYLLDAVNSFFGVALGRGDLTGAYAGVRPLISTGDPRKSVDISRKAELYETSSGLLTITGGKLTTWRRMAKQVVDRMVEREGREAPARTAEIPLGMPATDPDLTPPTGLPEEALPAGWAALLAFRYGHAARNVLEIAAERPELAAPIVPGRPDLLAEVAVAARLEQARSVADVLLRRTRLGILAAPGLRAADSVRAVAETLGGELGWSRRRTRREAEAWPDVAAGEGIDPAHNIASAS